MTESTSPFKYATPCHLVKVSASCRYRQGCRTYSSFKFLRILFALSSNPDWVLGCGWKDEKLIQKTKLRSTSDTQSKTPNFSDRETSTTKHFLLDRDLPTSLEPELSWIQNNFCSSGTRNGLHIHSTQTSGPGSLKSHCDGSFTAN